MVRFKPHEATDLYCFCVYDTSANIVVRIGINALYFYPKKYSLKPKFILTLAEWLGSSLMRQPICIVFVCMIPAQT